MIKPLREYTKEAFVQLNKIQSGDKLLPKTGFDFIDSHLGCLLPSDVCLISSPSGTGKTTIAQKIKKNLLDVNLNPAANNYVFLDYSLEMKVFNLVMRGSAELLEKKKSEVLFNKFTEEEKVKMRAYHEGLNDDRQFLSQVPPTPFEFYDEVDEFLTTHADKEAVFVSIDHVLLLKGTDKNKVLNEFCEQVNQLKLKHKNVYFLLISQNNRQIYSRIAEKSNLSAPNPTDVFGSSFLDQLCSFNIVLYNPFKAGISEYMKINPERYDYISKYYGEEDSKGRVSFITEGLIFAHCIKTRESDNPYQDIYVIDTGLTKEQKDKLKLEPKSESNSSAMPVFPPTPVVETFEPIEPISPEEAFGVGGDDEVPF